MPLGGDPLPQAPPAAGLTGSPLSGDMPLTVAFTNATTGTITDWFWGFGDGGSSTETSPTHVYTQSGVYTVSLAVSSTCGSDVLVRTSYITVSESCVTPTAAFDGSPVSGTAPLTVTFADASTGTIISWSWSFGDGGSSTETSPTHVYTQSGVYTVSLMVSSTCGSDVLVRTSYITVSSGGGYVTATTVITYT